MIPFLRQLFLHDFWLKFFSLTLATLIWLTVSFVIQKEGSPGVPGSVLTKQRTFYNLPILVVSTAADVHDFAVSPAEADVTLQGDPKTVEDLQSKDIRPVVDLTGLDATGPQWRRVEVSLPPAIAYVNVSPSSVQVVVPSAVHRPQ